MTARRIAAGAALLGAAFAVRALPAAATPTVVAPSPTGGARDDGAARFVLILGVNRSVDAELPVLHYADDDAVRYDDLFRALGGKTHLLARLDENTRRISPEAVASARDPRRAELVRAVASLAADVAAARARGQRTMFYFVYAGHGNVDSKTAYLALEDARLDSRDIEHDIIDKVHADESHLIIDACYSYFLAFGRGPGGRRREVPSFATAEGLAGRPDVGLLLSTTSARESHEWAGFQAGIFSHEVRSGLYGAADLDGDGRISYVEIAAFVMRANAAIPNERFRPEVYAHAPLAANTQLIDLRGAPGRRLRLDAGAEATHYLFEDTLGVRLADFHNASGHALSVLLPSGGRGVYLKRTSDEQEFVIPESPDVIDLADLSPQPPRLVSRGPADFAFNLIFSLPFDEQAVAEYQRRPAPADVDLAATSTAPLPTWRKATTTAAISVAIASGIVAIGFTADAQRLSQQAHSPSISQSQTAALNDRMASRRRIAEISAGVAGAAALAGAWLVFGPRTSVYPAGAFDGNSGTVGLAGGF
jgi:hypothetical protein